MLFIKPKTIKNTDNLSFEELKILLEKEFSVTHINKENSWQSLKVKHNNLKFYIFPLINDYKIKFYPPIWWNLFLLIVPTSIFLFLIAFLPSKFEILIGFGAFSFIITPALSFFLFFNKKINSFFAIFFKLTNLK